jgi:hypothetical protein
MSDAGGHHHEEVDTYPDQPAVLDSRLDRSVVTRAFRRAFGMNREEDKLRYPKAVFKYQMFTQGRYAQGYPIGAVVHSTEGRSKNGDVDAENMIEGTALPNKYCFFCISSTGKVYQSFLLDRWGSHAGFTWHPTLGENLSNKLVGIEVCGAGVVKKVGDVYKPEWSETFTEAEVKFSEKVFNVTERGFYHKFNEVQEKALFDLLIWLKTSSPSVFKLENVLGHDEIAVERGTHTLGRKQDPGASLSTFMPDFRSKLLAAVPSA